MARVVPAQMQRTRRGSLVVSLGAHATLFAIAWRLREPAPIELARTTLIAMEMDLQWNPPRMPAEPRALRVERVFQRTPVARAARTIERSPTALEPASPSAEPDPATTTQPNAGASERATPSSVTGMNLLRSMERDAFAHERWRFGPAPVEGPLTPEQESAQRALARNVGRITDRWRDDVLRAAPPPRPPGASEYVRRVTTEAARAWAPVRAQDPSIADGLLRLLLAGVEGYRAAQTDSLGMYAAGRAAAAVDSVEAAHPHSPSLQSNPTLNQAGRATAQRIAVEIDVRQAPDGSILSMRVARTSGTRFFDRQAEDAIRRAISQVAARPSTAANPTPTRSRWEFELRIARNPPIALGSQLPGAAPVFNYASGGVEWGGVDPPRAMYPFALHRYQRVRILSIVSEPAAPRAAPPVARDAGA